MSYTIRLTDEEAEFVGRPLRGDGGFQRLLAVMQAGLRHPEPGAWTLELEPKEARRVAGYADNYGDGGYQSRLRPIARKVKDLLPPEGQGSLEL